MQVTQVVFDNSSEKNWIDLVEINFSAKMQPIIVSKVGTVHESSKEVMLDIS